MLVSSESVPQAESATQTWWGGPAYDPPLSAAPDRTSLHVAARRGAESRRRLVARLAAKQFDITIADNFDTDRRRVGFLRTCTAATSSEGEGARGGQTPYVLSWRPDTTGFLRSGEEPLATAFRALFGEWWQTELWAWVRGGLQHDWRGLLALGPKPALPIATGHEDAVARLCRERGLWPAVETLGAIVNETFPALTGIILEATVDPEIPGREAVLMTISSAGEPEDAVAAYDALQKTMGDCLTPKQQSHLSVVFELT